MYVIIQTMLRHVFEMRNLTMLTHERDSKKANDEIS